MQYGAIILYCYMSTEFQLVQDLYPIPIISLHPSEELKLGRQDPLECQVQEFY